MNKKLVLTIVSLVVIVLGGSLLLSRVEDNDTTDQSTSDQVTSLVSQDEQTRYQTFSQEALENSDAAKTLVFFKADWCPTCRILDQDIKQNASDIPEDWLILEANFDDEVDLKNEYRVASQHTIVVLDENKEEEQKLSAILSLEDLINVIEI